MVDQSINGGFASLDQAHDTRRQSKLVEELKDTF
jgi:hypothetical protein